MLDKRNEFEDFILSLSDSKLKDSRTESGGYEDQNTHLLYLVYLTNIHTASVQ